MKQRAAQITLFALVAWISVAPVIADPAPGTAAPDLPSEVALPEPVPMGDIFPDENDPPVAADDWFSTLWETPVNIPYSVVLANDTDPDGDTLHVCGVGQPKHGTLSAGLAGSTYTPPDGCLINLDKFHYKVCDGRGGEDRATIYIQIGGFVCPDDPES